MILIALNWQDTFHHTCVKYPDKAHCLSKFKYLHIMDSLLLLDKIGEDIINLRLFRLKICNVVFKTYEIRLMVKSTKLKKLFLESF
jgi:hypothetical protein